ncbi:MAG: hypothetical protein IJZ59_05520 [Alphaproteobacteria bacterium]|nr:hypothetical protein [Alphaproteobacteria bacterium]
MSKNDNKKGIVVIDIDGVINSYSNRRFYLSFVYKSIKNLAKVHGRKKLLKELPKIKKSGGPNGLFKFAREYCGDDKKFDEYCKNLVKSLNFNLIAPDPSLKEFMRRLGKHGDIVIRSDGLSAIAGAAWQRVIHDIPSDKIKENLLYGEKLPSQMTVFLGNKKIPVSGIEDNNMQLKTDIKSWHPFFDKHNACIEESVLLDDSKNNIKVAQQLGMTAVHISKLDSFLEKSLFKCSLSDILGTKMSKTLKRCQIAYGQKVDVKTLFRSILEKQNNSEEDLIIHKYKSDKSK